MNRYHYEAPIDLHSKEAADWVFWHLIPIGVGPLEPEPIRRLSHDSGCLCDRCMTAGQHYSDYLKSKQLEF